MVRARERRWCWGVCVCGRRWFCKSCSGDEEQEEEADLSTRDVDPSLPVLGWRMHRGRFVEQG